jgi:CrcB protein
MRDLVAVGLGGMLGAVARYLGSAYVYRLLGAAFPWGTLAVNVLGCIAFGALVAAIEQRAAFSPEVRLFLGMGFLGSLTTFSTFGYETVELLRRAELGLALAYGLGSLLLGVLGVVGGALFVRWLGG